MDEVRVLLNECDRRGLDFWIGTDLKKPLEWRFEVRVFGADVPDDLDIRERGRYLPQVIRATLKRLEALDPPEAR
jgi:hypothetical protein